MGQIAEIIKYEGDNNTFIWKHPCEDFNSLTQLIVHESQEAVFFMNGQALDLFGAGRYTLETQNIPKLGKLLNRATGDQTPFHCEVYFINKTVQMALKWGTDSKVRYIDPESGLPLELGASGEMNLCVSDSRKLLIKLVGTMDGIAWGDERKGYTNEKNGVTNERIGFTKSLQNSFRPLISAAVKSNLASSIKSLNINILEIDEHLTEIGDILHKKVLPGFEEYGLTIPQFFLTNVVLPEDDPNFKRVRELYTISLQKRMISAEAEVNTAKAQAAAQVVSAENEINMAKARAAAQVAAAAREAVLERQQTQTEIARREAERNMITAQAEAERKIIAAQAEAEAQKAAGFAQAEIMRQQGYNQKDIIQAEVQKAYAAGIGNMGGNGGSGGSTMSDILGLGIGLQAASAMSGQVGNIFGGMFGGTGTQPQQPTQPTQPLPSQPQQPENAPAPVSQPETAPSAAPQPVDDMAAFKTKLGKLTAMKEAGIINDEEFNSYKAKLLTELGII